MMNSCRLWLARQTSPAQIRVDGHNGHSFRMEALYLDAVQVPELLWSLAQQWRKYEELRKPTVSNLSPRVVSNLVADFL